jgi:hypothetical protein
MKRIALLLAVSATALIVVLPATAGAATFKGVVIAKDSARKTLVTASRDGTVRTVRLNAGLKRFGVGSAVAVRGSRLPDGTFSAAAVRRTGKARHAHVRATLVKRLGARLALSAGGSVFALRLRGKAGASAGGGFQPGDTLDADADVKGGGLESTEHRLTKTGHDGQVVIEGIYLATAEDGTLELAVVHRGRVFVNVPDGVEVPQFAAGDEVALVVTVEDDGSLTLVKGENETDPGDEGEDEDGNVDIGHDRFSVAGILASVTDAAVAVKVEHRDEPVRCAVPDDFDLTGFEAGQKVYMTCEFDEGHFVLVELKQKVPPPSGDAISAVGTITELDSSHVSVEVDDQDDPVTCRVPAGMDLLGFTVGDEVKMYCVKADGGFVVKALLSDHAVISPEGSWFYAQGTILEVNSLRVSVSVEDHPSPVTCPVMPGADLSGFHAGDAVKMKCMFLDGGFKLKLLQSETAHYELLT